LAFAGKPRLRRAPVGLTGVRRGSLARVAKENVRDWGHGHGRYGGMVMHLPRLRFTRLAAAALAGAVVLSALVGPSLLPAGAGGNGARAEVVVEINMFESALSPYGSWIDSPSYGRVWYPTGVRRGWRPYYDDGHWAYSDDYGWIWVSDAPWGWAPFHYG